jgi:hypothetical protein
MTIPSGIATYSQAGAQFGYGLLWTVFLTTPFMIAIQLVSARIGRVTGKGLAANVMEWRRVGWYWRWFFFGLCEHVQHRGRHRCDGRISFAGYWRPQPRTRSDFRIDIDLLQVFVPYRRYSPVLKFLTLSLFAYVATALTVKFRGAPPCWRRSGPSPHQCRLFPDGGGCARDHDKPVSVFLAGLAGSRGNESGQGTPSASGTNQGGVTELDRIKIDTTRRNDLLQRDRLFHHPDHRRRSECQWCHQHQFSNEAAEALRPLAGDFTFLLFAFGIIGTGMLAIPVLAGSAAVWRVRGIRMARDARSKGARKPSGSTPLSHPPP